MISDNVLTSQPEIKPHTFSPSEDHPKELILTHQETGAALGISHSEKRIIELIDGNRSLADILQVVIQERIAPISSMRDLLWDLYRYGFLETSPWEIKDALEGWGYWGRATTSYRWFWILPLLGPLEKIIGRLFLSPIFHLFTMVLLGAGLWIHRNLFDQIDPFLIQNSVAQAILVVVVSFLGGSLIALWFGAMVLRVIHPSPIRCLIDYRYRFPIFRLDGRRLRSLSTRKALHAALSPIIGLLFVSFLSLLGAGYSEGARQEGLFHISVTLWLVAFFLIVPWNSTLLSREVMFRLRESSLLHMLTNSIRRAFHYLVHTRLEGNAHEIVFIAWGGWTIVSSLIFLRLIALTVRWKMPILVTHFVQEDNPLVLIVLFAIVGLFATALTISMLSFFVWLGREITREIRLRYWPHHDYLIVGIFQVALLFVMAQYFWSIPTSTAMTQQIPVIVCGCLLLIIPFLLWRSEGKGIEPLLHLIPMVCGIQLLYAVFVAGYPLSIPIETDPSSFHGIPVFSVGSLLLLLAYTVMYELLIGSLASTKPSSWGYKIGNIVTIVVLALIILASLNIVSLSIHGLVVLLILFYLVKSLIDINHTRQHSFLAISTGILILFLGFIPRESSDLLPGAFLFCLGTSIVFSGYLLRQSSHSKMALQPMMPFVESEWSLPHIVDTFNQSMTSLYGFSFKTKTPRDYSDDAIRDYFYHTHRLIGTQSFDAIIRSVIHSLPWKAAQHFIKLLPASVSVPKLTDWTSDKIIEYLKKVPTFKQMEQELPSLAAKTRFVMYQSGERLIHQGKKENELYIVITGNIAVEVDRPWGSRIIAIFEEGEFAGEIAFLSGVERTASVRALTPSLLLCIHRGDIDNNTPGLLKLFQEAEAGESWLQAFSKAPVFQEFPLSLSARVCLESQQVQLDRGESLMLETDSTSQTVPVFLSGKGRIIEENIDQPLSDGTLIGLKECLSHQKLQGRIRADDSSRILLVDRTIFHEALAELLIPETIVEWASETKETVIG